MPTPPELPIKEFLDAGYLLELNRLFLHPLGLAMFVTEQEDGTVTIGGIYDCRNEPEGFLFGPEPTQEMADDRARKLAIMRGELIKRVPPREELLGYWIQPAEDLLVLADGDQES